MSYLENERRVWKFIKDGSDRAQVYDVITTDGIIEVNAIAKKLNMDIDRVNNAFIRVKEFLEGSVNLDVKKRADNSTIATYRNSSGIPVYIKVRDISTFKKGGSVSAGLK